MEPDQINIDQLVNSLPEDDGTSAEVLSPEQIVSENAPVDEAQVAYEQEIDQEASEDPRDKENWGVRGLVKEAGSIISGGIQDTMSSISTFPELSLIHI